MKQKLKQFATSKWFDLLGVIMVIVSAIFFYGVSF